MSKDKNARVKLVLLGDVGVGKSSIIKRYIENQFKEDSSSTWNANFFEKEVKINGQKIILELWDTAGQEQFRSITQIFVKNSKIIILVYNITSKESFNSLNYWYDFIIKELGPNVILGLAGNKNDLIFDENYEEEVKPEEGKQYAAKIGASFALMSAKLSSNEIIGLFHELLIKYLDLNDNTSYVVGGSIKLDEKTFTREVTNRNDCCSGKHVKGIKLKAVFLGNNKVGKTAIIKAIKGKESFSNLSHTKKEYKESIFYKKNGQLISVLLDEINNEELIQHNLDSKDVEFKIYFLVFDIHRKDTLFSLDKYITKIGDKNKIYLLGYHNDSTESTNDEFNYENECENFAKKYKCEYEYITIDDIYKIKAIIIENIEKYFISNNA